MAKKKGRDCTECIAYCNMLGGEGYRCGLGFEVVEDVEGGFGMWIAVVHPYENSCSSIELPTTKEESRLLILMTYIRVLLLSATIVGHILQEST